MPAWGLVYAADHGLTVSDIQSYVTANPGFTVKEPPTPPSSHMPTSPTLLRSEGRGSPRQSFDPIDKKHGFNQAKGQLVRTRKTSRTMELEEGQSPRDWSTGRSPLWLSSSLTSA